MMRWELGAELVGLRSELQRLQPIFSAQPPAEQHPNDFYENTRTLLAIC
jgi:hypothetical protein